MKIKHKNKETPNVNKKDINKKTDVRTRTDRHTYIPIVNRSPLFASCNAIKSVITPSSFKMPMSKKLSIIDFVKYNLSFERKIVFPRTDG